jgi:hypothetical protein
MRLSWRARRRWALVALFVLLPAYIVAAVAIVGAFDRPPVLVELAVFVLLGVLWALPLRFVFLGIGRPDPDADGANSQVAGKEIGKVARRL